VAAGATRYLLESAAREWPLQAAAAHLHHDVARISAARCAAARAACQALPVALVLTTAASRSGLAVLAALRRQGK